MLSQLEIKVLKEVDGLQGELVSLLQNLIRSRSVEPPGDCSEAAQVCSDVLRSYSSVELVAAEEHKPSVIARLPSKASHPQLVLNAHIDTVPAGDIANWRYDPFEGRVVEGRLYGRGSGDDKGSVASMIMAAKALHKADVKLNGSLIINPVSDEEAGGKLGTDFLLKKEHLAPDLAVVGEQTENRIAIVERGVVQYKLKTIGKAAHGSLPWEGISAIKMMKAFLDKAFNELEPKLAERKHPLLPQPTLNIGVINGGPKANVVPDFCEVTIDRRYHPDQTEEEVRGEILSILRSLESSYSNFKYTLGSLVVGAPPNNTPPSHPLVTTLQGVCTDIGAESGLIGYRQASDGRLFYGRGVPTVVLGPGDPKWGHAPDEFVLVGELVEASKIYALSAMRILGVAE